MSQNRIKDVTEYSTSGDSGNKVDFTYNPDNTTTFKYHTYINGQPVTQQETYTFDNTGRTSSILNMDGSASTYSYTDAAVKKPSANKITAQAQTSQPVNNILLDHNAERNDGTWTLSNWETPGGTLSVDSTTYWLGWKSLKISQQQANPQRSGAVQKLTNLTVGTVYTLSAYVKTNAVTGSDSTKGASLYVAFFNGSTSISNVTGKIIQGTNDWQRVSLTFTVPANTTRVEIYGGLCYANGDAWFDAFQLETGSIANIYNLVENGDFRYVQSNLPKNWGTTNFASGDGMVTGNLQINGNATVNKNIYQQVYINKPANKIAFVVSGKSTGKSVPTGHDGRLYAIDAELYFTDTSSQNVIVPFNPDTTGEQFTSGAVAANQDNQGKTISQVIFYVIYYKNANSATFKFLQMNIDQTGVTNQYDDTAGTLTSSYQNTNNSQSYTYSGTKEPKTAALANSAYTSNNQSIKYTYDTDVGGSNPHRLISEYSPDPNRQDGAGAGTFYGYDEFGNVFMTDTGTISSDGNLDAGINSFIQTSRGFSNDGNYVTSTTDQSGNTTQYNVDLTTGLLNSVTDPKLKTTSYQYDTNSNLLTKISALNDSIENTFGYDNADRLNRITHNGFNYNFLFDGFGNFSAATISGLQNPLIQNDYDLHNGNLKDTVLGNGFKLDYNYDDYGRVAYVNKGISGGSSSTAYQYLYDARGNLAKVTDKTSGTDVVTNYSYDVGDRLIQKSSSDNSSIQYAYDNLDRPTQQIYSFAKQTKTASATYGYNNRKNITTLLSGGTVTHGYDSLNREYITDSNAVAGQEPTLRKQRTYVNTPNLTTTDLVASFTNYNHNGPSDIALSKYNYEYDANGNITKVTDINNQVAQYTYDDLNQLVRVDDQKNSVSTTYSYDAGGNITQVITYPYTTGTLGTPLDNGTTDYTYGNSYWKDLLTSYTNQGITSNITYDEIGNPLNYRDGMNFTWDGHQLKTAVANGQNTSYTYDVNGIRTSKTVGSSTTKYLLDGSTIIAQQTGSNVLWFLYDSDGTRIGFTYNGTSYFYTTDAQGDVTGIVDGNNTLVVEYNYDVWGKLLSTTGTMAGTIGVQNPFLYRGYYYDSETGLYYLNSRYYDPQTGRFINADSQLNIGSNMVSSNLFAYCDNNPVMKEDPTGQFAIVDDAIFWAAVGLFALGSVIVAYTASPSFQSSWNSMSQSVSYKLSGALNRLGNTTSGAFNWVSSQADSIAKGIGDSFARVTRPPNYKSSREVHHIVAQMAPNAQAARNILANVGLSVNSPQNLVSLKTGLHRRLHTNTYYSFANSIIIEAYNLGNSYTSRRNNVLGALGSLRATLLSIDAVSPF